MPRQFVLPAEYYDAPESGARPLFPKWVPYGCGAISILFLIVLVGGGTLVSSGGAGSLFSKLFGKMHDEMAGQFTKDVTPQQKAAFDSEFRTFNANLDKGTMPITKVDEVAQKLRDTAGDGKVTSSEVDQIVKMLDDANREAAAKGKPRH